jgi:membrane associated rhomboid family serine protease
MATKRGLNRALIKAAIVGGVSGAAVFFSAVAFDHIITTQNDDAIRNRGAFFEYVVWWAALPGAVGAGVASLLVDRAKWKRSYTLAEIQQMAALNGASVETLTEIIQIKDAENHE